MKYKAHQVVQDFEQVHKTDYNETYAPMARLVTLRILLAHLQDYDIDQIAVVTTFLRPKIDTDNGTAAPEVYMGLPEGHFSDEADEFNANETQKHLCRLRKSLWTEASSPALEPQY